MSVLLIEKQEVLYTIYLIILLVAVSNKRVTFTIHERTILIQ